ncbi:MAG TPA: hypothetical protein VFA15_08260, partial [Nitrososphaera sp.]|nr:hypothetical protein [Nitrososphaera sp.]
ESSRTDVRLKAYKSGSQVLHLLLQGAYKYVSVMAVIYLAFFFALASGLVNAIIEGRNLKTFIVPSRNVQTLGETIVITIILFMGMAGIFLLYQAGRNVNPRSQQGLVLAGFSVLAVALGTGFFLVGVKLG